MNIQMATKVFLGLLLFFFFLYWTVWALVDPVTNTFSPSVHCLFILFMISVTVKKLLSLIGSHLFIFAFISIIREDWVQKKYYCSFRQSVLPMFSSRSFIVFSLTLRSLIYFEFIFVYGIRECSNFILLQVAVQFSQHHLLKRLSFPHHISLPPLL